MIDGIFSLFFLLVRLAVGLLCFLFWLWMLIDAIQNPRLETGQKVVWVLVIIFLPFLGALLYFFVGRSKVT